MVKRLLACTVSLLCALASVAWAGENADAEITFSLEKEAAPGADDLMDVGPSETIVLSIRARGLSNLVAYTIDLAFEPDKMSYVNGGTLRTNPSEPDVFTEAGLSPASAFAQNGSLVGVGVAVLPAPGAGEAPDGGGLLAWMAFATSADFTTETVATMTLEHCVLRGVDGVEDEVTAKPQANVNGAALEADSWGRIKAAFW